MCCSKNTNGEVTEVTAWHIVHSARRLGVSLPSAPEGTCGRWQTPPRFEERVSLEEVLTLWEELVGEVGGEHVAATIGVIPREQQHSLLTFLCSTATTLGEAISTFERYWPIVTDAYTWRQRRADGWALVVRPVGPLDRSGWRAQMLYDVSDIVTSVASLTSQRVSPERVDFAHQLDEHDVVQQALGCEVYDNQTATGIVFNAADLEVKLEPIYPGLRPLLEKRAEAMLQAVHPRRPTSVRVRSELADLIGSGDTSLAVVARRLAMSERTLHRRLTEEGTNFRALLQSIRVQLAKQWLGTHSVAQVAQRLGYASPRSFRRAFKRSTGLTPSQFRK
jgi:AraC-like DNA-binding protein